MKTDTIGVTTLAISAAMLLSSVVVGYKIRSDNEAIYTKKVTALNQLSSPQKIEYVNQGLAYVECKDQLTGTKKIKEHPIREDIVGY